MFTIRAEQFLTLQRAEEARFVDELAALLRADGAAEPIAREQILAAMQRAEEYGLTGREELRKFVRLCGRYGWTFERLPENRWMLDELTDRGVTLPAQRLGHLIARIDAAEERARRNARVREEFDRKRSGGANPT